MTATPPAIQPPIDSTEEEDATILVNVPTTTSEILPAVPRDVFSEAESEQNFWAQNPSASADR